MLEANIQIAEYLPTLYHCKNLIIDSLFVSVGSTNFDTRSFRLNDEANLNIMDKEFAKEQIKIFKEDWEKSHPVTLIEWSQRTWQKKY